MKRAIHIALLMLAAALLCAWPVWSADEAAETETSGVIVIRVTRDDAHDALGYGWSREERLMGRRARWIKELEADLWFDLDEVSDMDIALSAAPQHLVYRRQNIGLYVNNVFVHEWTCPDSPEFSDYEAVIPASALKQGRNRLTFRMGYRRKHNPDRRELALAVEQVTLTPR